MTMDPEDRFSAPRRAPPPPAIPDFLGPRYRLPTAHTPSLRRRRSDRSLSPGHPNSWWSPRKLFARKHSTSSVHSDEASTSEASLSEEQRSSMVSSSSQSPSSRSMSPESLRRFLCGETPAAAVDAESTNQLALSIPDDIAEEDDDDEFVVASAASEFGPKTILSPPPPMSRHKSSHELRRLPDNESAVTLKAIQQDQPAFVRPRYPLPTTTFYYKPATKAEEDDTPTSRFSFSSDEGSVFDDDDDEDVDPLSHTGDNTVPSFSQSDAEEDDNDTESLSPPPINFASKRAGINMGRNSMEHSLAKAFEGYRLPRSSIDGHGKLPSSGSLNGEASVVSSPPLLALPIMDDFASELKSAGLF